MPEVLEAMGGEFGVAGGVLDVAVAEPFLDGAGIVLAMGEGEAAGMAQHVGMDGEGSSAAAPITASCFLNPAALIGVRRVDQQHDRLLGLADQFLADRAGRGQLLTATGDGSTSGETDDA